MSDMDIDRHLRAKIADLTTECQGLRADFERECLDTDTVLRALGFEPANCRTDGGSLKMVMMLGALEHRDVMTRRAARKAERERCAALCDGLAKAMTPDRSGVAEDLARAIREDQP